MLCGWLFSCQRGTICGEQRAPHVQLYQVRQQVVMGGRRVLMVDSMQLQKGRRGPSSAVAAAVAAARRGTLHEGLQAPEPCHLCALQLLLLDLASSSSGSEDQGMPGNLHAHDQLPQSRCPKHYTHLAILKRFRSLLSELSHYASIR